jgi:hypothetical protein
MRALKFLLPLVFLPVFLLGAVGFAGTSNKLAKMRMIRGTAPGALVQQHAVLEKWVQDSDFGPAYWIRFAEGDPHVPGDHRINLPQPVWERYEVGDPIEIIRVEDDPWPFHREDIFASDENFAFDQVLLVVEAAMMLFSVLGAAGLFWMLSRWERKRRASTAEGSFWIEE